MVRRLLIPGLMVVAAFAQIQTAGAQSNSPPFPRLGAYLIGGTIDFVNVPHIANMQMAIFSSYPGYAAGGKDLQQQVAAVKAINPNIKITAYVAIDNIASGSAYTAEYNAIVGNQWWKRLTWPNGPIVSTFGAPTLDMNVMSTTLASGKTYRQWLAPYDVGFTTGVASNLDGVYTDNFFWSPRVNADYLQNGTTQSHTNATIQQDWRNAYVDWDTQLRAAMGSQYMHWGNVADWAQAVPGQGGSIQGYNQLLNGGDMESVIGESWSVESQSIGWVGMMSFYALTIKAMSPFNGGGPYLLFQQDGSTLTDYQGMRYGLTSCLLDNGYYFYHYQGSNNIPWFDEFAVNLGAATAGPNNPTNGTYSNGGLTVWKQGVWRRDFANGIALVNPKGNGPQTVTLETTYKHFSGTQDSSVNNGQSVTSVTLNDRDGVILLRTTTGQQAVPDAPTLSVQ